MTEDTSPENLRKFLESDDPAMVQMGLSMAKGNGIPKEMLGLVAGLYMWHDDKAVRAAAKSVFNKYAPDELKDILRGTWNTSYRTIKAKDALHRHSSFNSLQPKVETMLRAFKDTLLDSVDVWKPALVRTSGDRISIVRIISSNDNLPDFTEVVEPLVKALEDVDGDVRSSAVEALGKIGDKRAVEPLIKALEDNPYRAAAALGKIGDKRAVKPLIKTLKDKDGRVRYNTAEALGKIGDERAIGPLTKRLVGNDVEEYYEELIEQYDYIALALNKLGWVPKTDGQKFAYLIAVKDWESLVEWGEPAVEPLIKALGECTLRTQVYNPKTRDYDNSVICSSAAEALGNIGDKRAVEELIKTLNHKAWRVKSAAAWALGNIGDKRAVEPIIKTLKESKWKSSCDWHDTWVKSEDKERSNYCDSQLFPTSKEALKKLGHEVE